MLIIFNKSNLFDNNIYHYKHLNDNSALIKLRQSADAAKKNGQDKPLMAINQQIKYKSRSLGCER
jgi:hypothetical protein